MIFQNEEVKKSNKNVVFMLFNFYYRLYSAHSCASAIAVFIGEL